MRNVTETTATRVTTLGFHVSDGTGYRGMDVSDIQPSARAGDVATALADRLNLPNNVPWSLRNSRTSRLLDDGEPIGDQIEADERVTIMPKAHLG